MEKRVTLTKTKLSRIERTVKRLLVSSRAALKQQEGSEYVSRWRFHVNEPDYAQAYGVLNALYLVGFLESTIEMQEMFRRLQDEVLEDDEDWAKGTRRVASSYYKRDRALV